MEMNTRLRPGSAFPVDLRESARVGRKPITEPEHTIVNIGSGRGFGQTDDPSRGSDDTHAMPVPVSACAKPAPPSKPLRPHLTFEGGNSLSKVWREVRRFSKIADMINNVGTIAPDLLSRSGDEALPPTRSQEKRRRRVIRVRLAE